VDLGNKIDFMRSKQFSLFKNPRKIGGEKLAIKLEKKHSFPLKIEFFL
jgi:hypothetical protein